MIHLFYIKDTCPQILYSILKNIIQLNSMQVKLEPTFDQGEFKVEPRLELLDLRPPTLD